MIDNFPDLVGGFRNKIPVMTNKNQAALVFIQSIDKQKFTQAEANYKKAADDLLRMNKEYEIIFEKIMELESQ